MSLLPHLSHPLPPRPPGKKKKTEFLGSWGAVGVLAGCIGCSCVLLRLFGFTLSLPKVASHGGDVGDDSWLKWQSTLLTVLRHSWICLFLLRAPFGQCGPVAATWALSVYRSRLAPWTRGESNHGKLSALRPLGHGRYRFATASAKAQLDLSTP